jgi:cyclopropane fatty-acyl-phospholipid synthase-like methyltransferase
VFQNSGKLIKQTSEFDKIKLPYSIDEYNMNTANGSAFLDIGSGFGKPVFHAAMQTGCPSIGVEIVPARVSFCQDQKYSMQDYY